MSEVMFMGCASGSKQGYFRLPEGMVSAEDRWDGRESFPSLLYTIVTAAYPSNDSFAPMSTFQLFRNVRYGNYFKTRTSSHKCQQQLYGKLHKGGSADHRVHEV